MNAAEPAETLRMGNRDQRIVIAGHRAQAAGRRQRGEPVRGLHEFARQREVGDVAGDDHVVGLTSPQVFTQGFQDFRPLHGAAAAPRPYGKLPLREALPDGQLRLEWQMQVRYVRKGESVQR